MRSASKVCTVPGAHSRRPSSFMTPRQWFFRTDGPSLASSAMSMSRPYWWLMWRGLSRSVAGRMPFHWLMSPTAMSLRSKRRSVW